MEKVHINTYSQFSSNLAAKWASAKKINDEHVYIVGDHAEVIDHNLIVSTQYDEYLVNGSIEIVETKTTLDGVRTTTTETIKCSCKIIANLHYKNGNLFPITLDSQEAINYYFSTIDCDRERINDIVFTEK